MTATAAVQSVPARVARLQRLRLDGDALGRRSARPNLTPPAERMGSDCPAPLGGPRGGHCVCGARRGPAISWRARPPPLSRWAQPMRACARRRIGPKPKPTGAALVPVTAAVRGRGRRYSTPKPTAAGTAGGRRFGGRNGFRLRPANERSRAPRRRRNACDSARAGRRRLGGWSSSASARRVSPAPRCSSPPTATPPTSTVPRPSRSAGSRPADSPLKSATPPPGQPPPPAHPSSPRVAALRVFGTGAV